MYAQFLGEENYHEGLGYDGKARSVPDLSIVGKHPWTPWTFEWPDVGFQLDTPIGGLYQPFYTLSLKSLYYPERGTWSPQTDVRARFGIPAESILALTMTCNDDLMDDIERDLDGFVERLLTYKENFDFIFCPNFSVYDNYPRLDNLFRIKFKWVGMERLQKAGFLVVPDVCFKTKQDFDNQLAWVRDNKANSMLFNFQVQATTTETREWKALLTSVRAFRDRLGHPVHLIAYGAVGGDRARSLVDAYGPDVTFMDAKSARWSRFHRDIHDVQQATNTVSDQFRMNCTDRRTQVAALKGRPAFPGLDAMSHARPVRFA